MFGTWISLVFISVLLVILLIQYLLFVQIRKKQSIENRLREFQLIAIKNQISPHFIFNSLNTISAMFMKGSTIEANNYLVDFSRLIRNVVETSDKTIVPLSSEISLIEKYLSIEKVRLGKSFSYTINIDEALMYTEVPSMSVHIFVENAIKHGLSPLKGVKILSITGMKDTNKVILTVKDNGRGFNTGRGNPESTGKGLNLVNQMFLTYKQIKGHEIGYEIIENPEGGISVKVTISTK